MRKQQSLKGGDGMSVVVTAEYKTFLKEIKDRIYKAQYDALKVVNKELINLYWDIGRSIVTKQEVLGWNTPASVYNSKKYFNKQRKLLKKRTEIRATN